MKRKAFTLIELLVVISVMIILMAMMLPAIKSMTRNNSQKQAVNQLASLIAHARSTAIQTGRSAGLVLYEDPAAKGQNMAQLVLANPLNMNDFVKAPGTGPQPLPKGIRIAALDDGTASATTGDVRSGEFGSGVGVRFVVFDNTGQLVLRNNQTVSTDPALFALWFGTSSNVVTRPGFLVYNAEEAKAAKDKGVIGNDSDFANWVKQNADILVINAYTGSIIR